MYVYDFLHITTHAKFKVSFWTHLGPKKKNVRHEKQKLRQPILAYSGFPFCLLLDLQKQNTTKDIQFLMTIKTQ